MKYIKNLYRGRVGRRNYVFGLLFLWLSSMIGFGIIGSIIFLLISPSPLPNSIFPLIVSVAGIFIFGLILYVTLLSFSLHVRRFHDLGLSGWYILLLFIPLLNLITLILFFKKGEEATNEFGEVPSLEMNFFSTLFNKSSNNPKASDSNNTTENPQETLPLNK